MIILEGFDNSGKTTLGRQLSNIYNYAYVHSPGPMDGGIRLENYALREIANPKPVIYDRFPVISDQVYAPIIRNLPSTFTVSKQGQIIKELFLAYPHIVIYCRPKDKTILNFGDREQMEGVKTSSKELIEAYDQLFYGDDTFTPHFITYDYEKDPIDKVLNAIMPYIIRRNKRWID